MSFGSLESVKEDNREKPVIQRIMPRTLPGALISANKGAIDWGWQSFIAYGCHNHVIVIDSQNVKIFQTLEQHQTDVVKVKFTRESFYHDLKHPYSFKLASADSTGNIIIWNVMEAKALYVLLDSSKAIHEMEWLSGNDSCNHLLLALHPPYSVILWDTNNGTKVWKKSYTESLLSFAFDPFATNRMAFLASDCILFVDDFSISRTPSSNGRKFFISNPSSSSTSNVQPLNNVGESRTRSIIPKRMKFLVRADSKVSDDGVTINECLQLSYHKSYRQHLLLLYPREILILDLDINQTVGIVTVDHAGSNIMHVHSCWQRDSFYILHENGSVTFRLRHRGHNVMAAATPSYNTGDTIFSLNEPFLEVAYDLHAQSDSLRLMKHAKIMGMAVCQRTECKVALLVSDGRLLLLDLIVTPKPQPPSCWPPHLADVVPKPSIYSQDCRTINLPCPTSAVFPTTMLCDSITPMLYPCEEYAMDYKHTTKFKLFITGHLCALASPPLVIKMCPPVTFRNWKVYQPLMAVGNSGGSIQVINMASGMIVKDFTVHAFPVRGIEWIGLTSFLTYAHTNTVNNMGHVRNEVVLTDIQSGRTKSLRAERHEESPIEMIRVSHLRQYAIIVFKEEPFELWDLRLLTVLRTMPKNFPYITALEWSPVHRKSQATLDAMMERLRDPVAEEYAAESYAASKSLNYAKEHFIFTDTNGQLHHFSVEGNVIQDGTTIPVDFGMECVSCIAWKGDYIILGLVDGNICILHLKENVSNMIPTHRGWIKKICVGPGKGNLRAILLFNDGIDVWDLKDKTRVHSIKCPRDMTRIRDIDWVGSHRPCFATSDGCIRITDIKLDVWTSSALEYEHSELPFSPYTLPERSAFFLKSYLQHMDINEHLKGGVQDPLALAHLELLDEEVMQFIKTCPLLTAERSLHIARLFGDEDGYHFWTIALHYLKAAKCKQLKQIQHAAGDTLDNVKNTPLLFFEHPLDTAYDIFSDNCTFKKLQLDRISLHVHKRTTYSQTQQCAERLLLLGETERAVQLFLETENTNNNFYVDCLRACLTATVHSSGSSLSIVKLVSTNLIASGQIMEGVQLLCLIEKGLDACKYLLTSDRWDEAVWLAKATLPASECNEILKRWIDHLFSNSVNQKNKGLSILLSMNEFWKTVQTLRGLKMVERAALLLQSSLEFGVIERTQANIEEISAIFSEYETYLKEVFSVEELPEVPKHTYWWRD